MKTCPDKRERYFLRMAAWKSSIISFFMPVFKLNDVFAGRYILSELIGEGGFSEVWKARDQMADEAVVAIKIYAPEKGLDDYGVRQFRKEFSLTHHLTHPHLMKVYHFDISDGSPYLIMPYCPFGSLSRVVAEEGVFSERQVALVMCQVGSALEELHSQEPAILHQDIKPDNILVLNSECFLLADFGISNQIRHTLRKSTSDTKSLTIAYAPPERFDRHPVSDASSDIFSLGVTLYEICTNSIPWEGYGGQSLLKGGHIPHLPEAFSEELNKLLQACMSVDRSRRPGAADLHLRGRNFLETGQWQLVSKESAPQKPKKSKLPYFIAAAVVLLVFAGFLLYGNFNNASPKITASFPERGQASEELRRQLQELEAKAAQLEITNLQLVKGDSLNKSLLQEKDALLLKYKEELAEKEELLSSYKKNSRKPGPVADKTFHSTKNLEEYLNLISNSTLSKESKLAWKEKTLEQFENGSVRILDESDGTLKNYSAAIFLNFLISVPHHISVKEVKRNRSQQITELRLSMQPKL